MWTRPWPRFVRTAGRFSSSRGICRTHAPPWSPIRKVLRSDSRRCGAAFRTRPNPSPSHFFWDEYLARDAVKALDFYKRLAGYESAISESRSGVEYHVLRKTRARAGLFQLPATATGVEPNWLPYVLVDDPAALGARVGGLGGRILLPAAPERRNGSVVVIADPGGAPLALQKFPF